MVVETLKWVGDIDGFLELIDQRKLPVKPTKIKCQTAEELFDAIQTLAVRGAPAIGVCAAYGIVLALKNTTDNDDLKVALSTLEKSYEYLASSRPTAVNLFWALDRVRKKANAFATDNPDADTRELREMVLSVANKIFNEDVEMCRMIGLNGARFIKENSSVLTHCNAGALATAGTGTALAVLYEARKSGTKFKVYADETRPLLQGARLTAWELKQAGIDVTVICDNMAGWLMKQGKIDIIITGADRIAANGDAANKIGTYSLSILAKEHKVPFYIAAPTSTFDPNLENGHQIPIEERSANEVKTFAKTKTTPEDVDVCNPAFDVTEARNITAIITELGLIERPDKKKISEHLKQ